MTTAINPFAEDEYWSKTFTDLDLSGVQLSGKEFDGCTFKGCNFSDATFNKCKFVDCEFSHCNLSVINIAYSKFSDVIFDECKVIGVNWSNAAWSSLSLSAPIKFHQCIINDSSFYGLSLTEIVIEQCRAINVDFREGDFSDANFSYTDFSGSLFHKTNLSRADFSEATDYDIDIYNNIIKGAKFCRLEAVRLLDSLEVELVD
ncbi:pentapeptide repeat-containing protein [Oceanicoccus sp. KOV_DT_Chl]|uniref:pentapeptide repeat-containing protein n=1 Tax=Oceanicoccus sp. KOV_DT_Chl TaxID=1904639 RepID=UPI000C7D81BF|nr:pentapeptide repeat-containing protein [Oceanicoccus sp. KOV_DT_Chl]